MEYIIFFSKKRGKKPEQKIQLHYYSSVPVQKDDCLEIILGSVFEKGPDWSLSLKNHCDVPNWIVEHPFWKVDVVVHCFANNNETKKHLLVSPVSRPI